MFKINGGIMIIEKKKIPNFTNWLQAGGAEILPNTNPYELLRFRCKNGTGVIYANSAGKTSASSTLVTEAIDCFRTQKSWKGKGKPTKRTKGSKSKRQLLDRDGDDCWYCGKPLQEKPYNTEHLINITCGGSDRLENKVLTHVECNEKAGHKPLHEKILLRDRMRGYI